MIIFTKISVVPIYLMLCKYKIHIHIHMSFLLFPGYRMFLTDLITNSINNPIHFYRRRIKMCSFHSLLLIILTISGCAHVTHAQSAVDAHPPYAFLCSFHGNERQPSLDTKELTVSISIEGNPSYYETGSIYQGDQIRILEVKVNKIYRTVKNHFMALGCLP